MDETEDNKAGIQNRHNNYVVQCLDDVEFGIEFYNTYLADYAKGKFEPDSIIVTKGHYVSNEFADCFTDVLYQGKLKTQTDDSLGYIYLLAEHKSAPEKTMDIQLTTYMMNIALKHLRDHPKSRFPVIIPMVLYHGKQTPYPYNLDWLSIFDDPDNLMAEVFKNPIHLVDLNMYPDEQLKQFRLVGVMSQLLKHIRDPALLEYLPPIFNGILDISGKLTNNDQNTTLNIKMLHFIRNSLAYVITAAPELKEITIINELVNKTNEPIRREIMSLADVLREEGFEKGQAKGREEGFEKGQAIGCEETKLKTAQKMIAMGAEDTFILGATDITQVQLESLKKMKIHSNKANH